MAIVEVKVPQLSESVAEGTMLQWKKKVGDVVAVDEILIEIETDKVVLEVPAPSAGVLSEIIRSGRRRQVDSCHHSHRRTDQCAAPSGVTRA
jgi:ribosomal protein L21